MKATKCYIARLVEGQLSGGFTPTPTEGFFVTLAGGGLGVAPVIEYIRTFQDPTKSYADALDTNPQDNELDVGIGGYVTSHPEVVYADDSKGIVIADGVNGTSRRTNGFDLTSTQKVGVQVEVTTPSGRSFCGGQVDGGLVADNGGSNLKLVWVGKGDPSASSGEYDMCLPTKIGGSFRPAGNSSEFDSAKSYANLQDYDFSPNSANIFDSSLYIGDTIEDMTCHSRFSSDKANNYDRVSSVDKKSAPDRVADTLFISGWAGNDDQSNAQLTARNLIVSTGDGYSCRVYLGDASYLRMCSKLTMCIPTVWEDGRIDFTPLNPTGRETHVYVQTADFRQYWGEIGGELTEGYGELQTYDVKRDSSTGVIFSSVSNASYILPDLITTSLNVTGDFYLKVPDLATASLPLFWSGDQMYITSTGLDVKLGGTSAGVIPYDFTALEGKKVQLSWDYNGATFSCEIRTISDTDDTVVLSTDTISASLVASNTYVTVKYLFRNSSTRAKGCEVYHFAVQDLEDTSTSVAYLFEDGWGTEARNSICDNYPLRNINGTNVDTQPQGVDPITATYPVYFGYNPIPTSEV